MPDLDPEGLGPLGQHPVGAAVRAPLAASAGHQIASTCTPLSPNGLVESQQLLHKTPASWVEEPRQHVGGLAHAIANMEV
jgi:hypothetical protein